MRRETEDEEESSAHFREEASWWMLMVFCAALYLSPGSARRVAPATSGAAATRGTPAEIGPTEKQADLPHAPGNIGPEPSQPSADSGLAVSEAIYRRAKTRMATCDYVAAICDFDEVLRIRPDFVWCYYDRAGAYRRMGNQTHALADLDRAILAMPAEAKVWRARAVVHHRMRDLTMAVADICRAVELAEDGVGADDPALGKLVSAKADKLLDELFEHATANLRQRRWQEAIAEFGQVLKRRPKSASAWLRRATAYNAAGQFQEALDDVNVALRLRPAPAKAYRLRSVLHERNEDYAGALA
ncbi:MAG TPA: tetratricopeptide repeat protein, partial [Pirellulales bacterium]|nr:tetratricopeptide repeat protein [Pirellulales bacterium]